MTLPQPYLLFLGDATSAVEAKTAFGLRDWAIDRCVGEYRLPSCTISTGLPLLTPAEARQMGARSLVVGVANFGGVIPDQWIPSLVDALTAGLDLVSGLHRRLEDVPELKDAADRLGRRLINVRIPPAGLPCGNGRKRTGKRLLTVGTDCALGKKYTALTMAREFEERGIDVHFRATGQTGIMIGGGGIPMDAVVSDFLAGAAEKLTPDAADDHWDVIEGQGSLFHPSYAAVSLGLLHGSQPDVIILCHDPARHEIMDCPGYSIPSLQQAIDLNLRLGARTNPQIRCAGISLNTASLSPVAAQELLASVSDALALPVADPIRGVGLPELVKSCLMT